MSLFMARSATTAPGLALWRSKVACACVLSSSRPARRACPSAGACGGDDGSEDTISAAEWSDNTCAAVGFWKDLGECSANWSEDKRWDPQMDQAEVEKEYKFWKKAVTRTFDWVE